MKFCQCAEGQGIQENILWMDNENISAQQSAFSEDVMCLWDFTGCHSRSRLFRYILNSHLLSLGARHTIIYFHTTKAFIISVARNGMTSHYYFAHQPHPWNLHHPSATDWLARIHNPSSTPGARERPEPEPAAPSQRGSQPTLLCYFQTAPPGRNAISS